MKKIIPIISAILAVGVVAFIATMIFRTSSVESVEIVGDIQTVYFVDSTNTANFNDTNLKVTYKDGSVKLKKLSYKNVSVKNFSTAIANDGTMKITYKSQTIDVEYSVVWTGLYYLSERTDYLYNGSNISTSTKGPYVAGVNDNNQDKTNTLEMIYFNNDGTCDYYSRSSSTGNWYMDDGFYDKSFNYIIDGDTIKTQLGNNRTYEFKALVTNDGEMTLQSTQNNYATNNEDVEFLKSRIDRTFEHYEMKGNRTIGTNDIKVICNQTISFKKNSEFKDSNLDIYVKVNYKNDNFLKNVYVRFNEAMFATSGELETRWVTDYAYADCYYNGARFDLEYSIKL